MKKVFVSSATALPDYDGKRHIRAFCIHTVMTQQLPAPPVPTTEAEATIHEKETARREKDFADGEQLPWRDALWGGKNQRGKFRVALVDPSVMTAPMRVSPNPAAVATGSLEPPEYDSLPRLKRQLTGMWADPGKLLAKNLAALPRGNEVEENELEQGNAQDPDAQSGSAWLASLGQQAWPVPQSLGLSQFVVMPEDHDSGKSYLVYPDRGSDPEITYQQAGTAQDPEIWEVYWPADGISFQIHHEHQVPRHLVAPAPGVPGFLSTKEVVGRQPDATRFWGQQMPLLFGRSLNFCEWLGRLVKEKRLGGGVTDEAVKNAAYDLLRVHGHHGLSLLLPPASSAPDVLKDYAEDSEAAALFPSRFPLKEMVAAIKPGLTKAWEKEDPMEVADLKVFLDRIEKLDGPGATRDMVTYENLPSFLAPPKADQWRKYVAEVIDKRSPDSTSGKAPGGSPAPTPGTELESFMENVTDLSKDDDVLVQLWIISWFHTIAVRKSPADPYAYLAEQFATHGSTLKVVIESSGRRLAEHYGDTVSRAFWRKTARAYRTEIEKQQVNDAGAYSPVFVAVKQAHTLWLDKLATGLPTFPVEASVLREMDGQSPAKTPHGEKTWLNEMVPLITGGHGIPKDNGEREFQAAHDAHPLQILPPHLDTSRYRGMAVFSRAVPGSVGKIFRNKQTDWRCLTLGRMRYRIVSKLTGEPEEIILAASPSVTAHAADECNGIQQSYLGYRMRRIGVTEETLNTSHGISGEAAGTGGADPGQGFICRDLDTDKALDPKKDWGLVTALRYSRNLAYEFAFAAIHSSGALPKGIAKPGSPCELAEPKVIRELLEQPGDDGFDSITLRRWYHRRAAVGAPRFNATTAALQPGQLPGKPAGITLLADDLYTRDFTEDASGAAAPAPRPQVIFLHDNRREFSFNLSAPSISRDFWRHWMLGQSADIPPLMARAAVTLHHLAGMESEDGKVGVILSDPAVCGVHISLGAIFPVAMDGAGKKIDNLHGIYQHFEASDISQVKRGDYGEGLAGDAAYARELASRQKRYLTRTLVIRISGDNSLGIDAKDANHLVIWVPRNSLAFLRICPCVTVKEIDRFENYSAGKVNPTEEDSADAARPASRKITRVATKAHGEMIRLNRSALNWRVEVAPSFEGGTAAVVGAMPTPLEIFNSLELQRNQPDRRKDFPTGNLRALLKVTPSRAAYLKWLWVSDVKVVVQKWRWNGLPPGSCGMWTGASSGIKIPVPPPPAEPKPVRSGMASVLDQVDIAPFDALGAYVMGDIGACEDAETSAYGNRGKQDAAGSELKVNYACEYMDWKPKPQEWENGPLEIELHCEEGDAGRDPSYYRVRLEVTHRYAALLTSGPERDSLTLEGNNRKAALAPVDTPWKRIMLAGIPPSSLAPPRVKMILPLMEAEPSGPRAAGLPDARPGFIVLTRDTLPSPFHRLIGTLEIADFRHYQEDLLAQVDLLPEIGPDPMTSRRGSGLEKRSISRDALDLPPRPGAKPGAGAVVVNLGEQEMEWEEKAVQQEKEKYAVTLEGEPFGLSWEREAGSALFPHAGFFFGMEEFALRAGMKAGDLSALIASDLMAKLRFRWQIDSSALWAADQRLTSNYLQGKESGSWWVRSLAPFRLELAGGASWTNLRFDYLAAKLPARKPRAALAFQQNGQRLATVPRFAKYDSVGVDDKNTELCSALLFLCWATITDGTSNRGSRTMVDAFLVDARMPGLDKPPLRPIALINNGPGHTVTGGQFILVHFRGVRGGMFDPKAHEKSGKGWPSFASILEYWIATPEDEYHKTFRPSFDLLCKYLFTGPFHREFKKVAADPAGQALAARRDSEEKNNPDAQGMVVRSSPMLAHVPR